MAAILDGYAAMRTHVLVRFGRWQELVASPGPEAPSRRPIGVAMHAYGQGVAHAALGRIDAAEACQAAYEAAYAAIPEAMVILSNPVHDVLEIGAVMLEGELE